MSSFQNKMIHKKIHRKHLRSCKLLLVLFSLFARGVSCEPLTIGPCPPALGPPSTISTQEDAIQFYFNSLRTLQKGEQWEEIVTLGQVAISECQANGDLFNEFLITDQLVSTYFRLGAFVSANEYGKRLVEIGALLNASELYREPMPGFIIDSLYKLSATLRGMAGIASNERERDELFAQAKTVCERALNECLLWTPEREDLKARVLFNLGAAECDDPHGDFQSGITHYEEALNLFTKLGESDYRQRTLIRLGKAYFLLGDFEQSRNVIEEVQQGPLEMRTKMHLLYLEAQVLKAERVVDQAQACAEEGRKISLELHAEADLGRFNAFLRSLENPSYGE